MKKIFITVAVIFPLAIFADFWKELNKVVTVLDELSAPTVSNMCFTTELSDGKPSQISSSFPKNTKKIYVWFNIYGSAQGQSISSVWMKKQAGEYTKIYELSKQAPADQSQNYMDFSLAVPENSTWPTGKYKVDIVWNNKILASSTFKIDDSVSAGEGVWSGESLGNPATPNTADTLPVPQPAVGQDIGILTEQDKEYIKNLTAEDLILMIGSSIHNEQTKYGTLSYKYRNDPKKLEELNRTATESINKIKRWGNAALALKGLPPRWTLDATQGPGQSTGGNAQDRQERKQENFDFNF